MNSHPLLHRLFREVTRSINDPKAGKSMFEAWRDLQNEYRQTPSVDGWGYFFNPDQELKEPWIFESPSDDAAPFFHQLALPASDMYYGADYGMYHSIYENFHWMKTVVDPEFKYHIAMAQLQGFVSLRLANADLIQLDFSGEAKYWRMAYNALAETAKENSLKVPLLQDALHQIDLWEKEADALESERFAWLHGATPQRMRGPRVIELNRKLYLAARDFYREKGLPGAQLERNFWAGSDGILPGLAGSLEKKDGKRLKAEAMVYLNALKQRVKTLRSIRAQLRAL